MLTLGWFVGTKTQEDAGQPFEEKMQRLVAHLRDRQAGVRRLDETIWKNLKELGYGRWRFAARKAG